MSHHLKILQRNLQKIEYEGLLDRLETLLKKFQEEILQSEVSNTSEINAIYSELLGVG